VNKFFKTIVLLFGFWIFFLLFLQRFDSTNPIFLYTVVYPLQHFKAYLEASDLKPHWQSIAKNKGDCRIQNTIAAMENPNLYIVFGKLYDPKTKTSGDHQWTTLNPENPGEYKYIIDRTTGLSEEKKKRAIYEPYVVYKFDVNTCTVQQIRAFKKFTDKEEFLIKSGEFYVRSFCKFYKEKHGS